MRYQFKPDRTIRYPADVAAIVETFARNGHEISAIDAHLAWDAYSDSMCAGWLGIEGPNDTIVDDLLPFIEKQQMKPCEKCDKDRWIWCRKACECFQQSLEEDRRRQRGLPDD